MPPRGVVVERVAEVDAMVRSSIQDAVDEALQLLLVRVARTVALSGLEPRSWLEQVTRTWPPQHAEAIACRLAEPSAYRLQDFRYVARGTSHRRYFVARA